MRWTINLHRQEEMNEKMNATMSKPIRTVVRFGSVTALVCVSAMAQEASTPALAKDVEKSSQLGEPTWQAIANVGYVGGSATKFQGAKLADSEASNFNLGVGRRFTLADSWFLKLGLMSDNFYMEQVSGAPVPKDIHTLRLNVGLGYRWNEKWTFSVLAAPTLYRFDATDISDVGISGGLQARYQMMPSLTLSAGVIVAPDSNLKVLPMLGIRWLINDHYTVEVGMPKNRVSYKINSDWTVYAGADLNGTTFRASENLGTVTGFPRYNNAIATYRDVRIGAGVSYEFIHGFRAEIEGGGSVYREIFYTRIEERLRFKPTPYIRLGVSVQF